MGVYRRVYQPFGMTWQEEQSMRGAAAMMQETMQPNYRTDWPGIIGTAERLGLSAAQLATGAQPLDPGAGVLLDGGPPPPPTMLDAPPPGTPGVLPAPPGPPWLLIGGAVALYYFLLK